MTAAVPARRILPSGTPGSLPAQARRWPGLPRLRRRRRGRGLLLAGTAAFALLLAVVFPAVAAATAPPAPAPAPSTDTPANTGPTPNPQPGPSPIPPGQETPAIPAPSGGDATPAPDAPDTPPDGGGTGDTGGSDEPCPADDPDCATTPEVPPPPTPQTTPPAPDTGGDGGSVVGWITDAINDAITAFFRTLVTAALNPLLDLLGRTLLTTPEPSQLPAIGELWSTSWAISATAYSALIMFGGITVMSLGTVQSRISIKEIAPRIPLGFLASGLSQFLATKAIQIANAMPGAILGQGLNPDTTAEQLRNIVLSAIVPTPGGFGKSIFVIFLGLFLAGSVVALLCTYIARIVIEVSLIGMSPAALAGHGHPMTEKIAFWWWRAFFGCLGIQIAQSFVLIASFKVFFTPGGFTVFGPTPDGVVNLLAAITLIYFLFKIPFWMMPKIGHGGSSILGRIVRAYVMGRALGMLGGRFGRGTRRAGTRAGRGRGGGGRGRPRRGGPGGGRGDGSSDPYARVEADRDGQLLLPLTRVPRVRRPRPAPGAPRKPRSANPAARSRPRHRQLTIPFDQAVAPGGRYLAAEGGVWVDRDGQPLLPFEVDEPRAPVAPPPTRRASSASSRTGTGRSGTRRTAAPRPARQKGQKGQPPSDPYKGARANRSGQYALPLEGLRRTPRSAPPATPAVPPSASRATSRARRTQPRYQQQLLPAMPRRPSKPRKPPKPPKEK
ncbi:hypothetical protein Franean1_2546 [Parafrankia sp. EAN1pec]|uniref:hypothetical protein n=1 Tax=Parafrankia sp. (strain EAN1pec) TaxID=298653 RepID=UPI0000541B49|nr:hypothetical protein Franean1_2546 [Frankia sp. EAN1pec]